VGEEKKGSQGTGGDKQRYSETGPPKERHQPDKSHGAGESPVRTSTARPSGPGSQGWHRQGEPGPGVDETKYTNHPNAIGNGPAKTANKRGYTPPKRKLQRGHQKNTVTI